MKKTKVLFIIWGVLVVGIIILLTTLGFMLNSKNKNYLELEDKLLSNAKKFVDNRFLYPEEGKTTKVTSDMLIENEYLDELKFEDDTCTGYVIVSFNGVYQYKAYIKCNHYQTKGYEN